MRVDRLRRVLKRMVGKILPVLHYRLIFKQLKQEQDTV